MAGRLTRSRWAAIGAAVAVTLGGGGVFAASATESRSASSTVSIIPIRVMDTRSGLGASGSLQAGQTITLPLAGTNGIPADATAVMLNVTVVGGTAPSFLTVYPAGASLPNSSSVNWSDGRALANGLTVGVGADGKVAFFNQAGIVHVIVDVQGYVAPAIAVPGLKGDQGVQGPAGVKGDQGIPGVKGDSGVKGDQGLQGLAGAKGDQGIAGTAGLKGDQGVKGDQGLQGLAGVKGDQGIAGTAGLKGDQGVKGDQGLTGAKGDPGVKGDAGSTGAQGATGPTGGTPVLSGGVPFIDPLDLSGYVSVGTVRMVAATPSLVNVTIPAAATLKQFYVRLAHTTGSVTATAYVNNVATSLTCTVAAAVATCSDTADSVVVAAGDLVAIRVDNTNAAAITNFSWTAVLAV
jgi:hypothetical protein